MEFGKRCCIALPSLMSSEGFHPATEITFSQCTPHDLCSSKSVKVSIGRTTAAFKATHSMAEPAANAVYNLVSSDANDFPAFPNGGQKKLGLQWTTSS